MKLSTLAVAGQVAWKRIKPVLLRDTVLLPTAGFVGLIALWWIIALW
jgi:nitrate/nitrite transport system permease protein